MRVKRGIVLTEEIKVGSKKEEMRVRSKKEEKERSKERKKWAVAKSSFFCSVVNFHSPLCSCALPPFYRDFQLFWSTFGSFFYLYLYFFLLNSIPLLALTFCS